MLELFLADKNLASPTDANPMSDEDEDPLRRKYFESLDEKEKAIKFYNETVFKNEY